MGISNEFTSEQAAYMWQEIGIGGNSDDLLNSLSRNNAFITKIGKTYRYHHMLQQCTRHNFFKKPEEYQQKAYTSMGDWYMIQEDYIPAYYAFSNAKNYGKILSCIEKDRARSLNSEHQEMFFTWIDNCPEEVLLQYPSAITICMLTMFTFNNIEGLYYLKGLLLKSLEMDERLSEEEKNNLLGDAEISESFVTFNDITAMSQYHRRACKLLNRPTYSIDTRDLWTFGSSSVLMLYHRTLGLADNENDEMKECMPYYYQVADGHGRGSEHIFNAELHYERGEFIDADIANKIALAEAKREKQTSILLASEFLNMRLELLEGNFATIENSIKKLRDLLLKKNQYELQNSLDYCQAFIAAMLNRPEDAPEWLYRGRLSENLITFPAMPMVNTYYNQLLLAKGEYTSLIARKDECQEIYGVFNNLLCFIWLHIQLSGAFEKIGKFEDGIEELEMALNLAMPDNILMPFAENEQYIHKQLLQLKDQEEYGNYVEKIMELAYIVKAGKEKIMTQHFGRSIDYDLSERELEIAKLAARRMTNAEIAQKLYLSEGTIRNYLSRIFDKLEIHGDKKNKRHELEKLFKS